MSGVICRCHHSKLTIVVVNLPCWQAAQLATAEYDVCQQFNLHEGIYRYLCHLNLKTLPISSKTFIAIGLFFSAGVGRTGTYIALDILTEQGKRLGYVDVAGVVASLRRQRVNMVQNLV